MTLNRVADETSRVEGPLGIHTIVPALRNTKIVIGGVVLLLVLLFCVVIPTLDPARATKQHLRLRLSAPSLAVASGSMFLPFGTDALGRDLVHRIAAGGRYSLYMSIIAAAFTGLTGSALGLAAGYIGGAFERIVMSVVDIQLSLPVMLVALLLIAVMGPGVVNLMIAMIVSGWALYTRMVRARVLVIRGESYVEAAQAIGASRTRLMFCHIFPQTMNMVIVLFTQQIGFYIMLESSLSYLGLGVRVPTPSWGNIIADGRAYIAVAWWITTLPGIMLVVTVSALFLFGDGLRDLYDPRLRRLRK